jgi:hypothetical protein
MAEQNPDSDAGNRVGESENIQDDVKLRMAIAQSSFGWRIFKSP